MKCVCGHDESEHGGAEIDLFGTYEHACLYRYGGRRNAFCTCMRFEADIPIAGIELAALVIENCDHAETVQAAIALLRITELAVPTD